MNEFQGQPGSQEPNQEPRDVVDVDAIDAGDKVPENNLNDPDPAEHKEQVETAETSPEDESVAPPEPDDKRVQEERRRQEIRSALQSFFRIKRTDALTDQEIIDGTKEWTEKNYGVDEKNLAEILKYFELAESTLCKFPPEQKIEVACALAELVAEGIVDAETLQALAFKIVKNGESKTLDKVVEYSREYPGIIVYDELYQEIDGQPQNIVHILKHEISHGLCRYGEIAVDEESLGKADEMIEDADNLRSRETHRSVNAIDQYLAVKNKEGATEEEISQMSRWLSGELLSEKIAAYLQSGGKFGGFIEAQLRVMPEENIKKLFQSGENEFQDRWLEENKFFFDKIAAEMEDKPKIKEKILSSTEEARQRMSGEEWDDEFDYSDFLGDGYGEPAIPDNSKMPGGQTTGGKGGMIESLAQLADAVGSEIEESLPGTEELKKAA